MKEADSNFLIFPIHYWTYETSTAVLSELVLKCLSTIIDLYFSRVLTSFKSLSPKTRSTWRKMNNIDSLGIMAKKKVRKNTLILPHRKKIRTLW